MNDGAPGDYCPMWPNSWRESFARLHFLRNYTTHRCSVVPVCAPGHIWYYPDGSHDVKDLAAPPNQDVSSQPLPYAGMWIRLPADPRNLAGAWESKPVLAEMSSYLDFVRTFCSNILKICFEKLHLGELQPLGRKVEFTLESVTLEGKKIVVDPTSL